MRLANRPETLAANSIGRFPQNGDRFADRLRIDPLTGCGFRGPLGFCRADDRQKSNGMFAVALRQCNVLVQDSGPISVFNECLRWWVTPS